MSTKKNAEQFIEELLGEPMSLSLLLQGYMAQHGLTQVELAGRLKVSRGFVNQLVTKRRFVSLEKAAEIAKALGEPEKVFVKVALQDLIDNAELDYEVDVEAKKRA